VNGSRTKSALIAAATTVAMLALAPAAGATIATIPDGDGGTITCTVQVGGDAGERHCSGIFTTFDGAPIDINVGFPPELLAADGDYPIIGVFHGWGGSKASLTSNSLQQWLDDGYAVFSMSDRGWGMSCGGSDPKRLQPVCAEGYNHLMDTRFEVRDAQEVFEALADQPATGATSGEGLIDPEEIGVTGGSYGGGISMALAALKNRKMITDDDGTLVPWVSGGGKEMEIAAAQPDIPWTDLAYSLQPNGHTLDYVADAPYDKRGRIGVIKQSFVAGLYGTGQATSNYAPLGSDPDADLNGWYALINAGEPYDQSPLAADITDEITAHHSSYYIDDSTAPAPLLISNGWTDDLFPPDEAIRFYNRTRTNHPGTPISLIFSDHGHQRGQNKGPDATFRNRALHDWFDFHVKGLGSPPFDGVQTLTQTCGTPSGGATGEFDDPDLDTPFQAATWAELAPGEVRHTDAASKTVVPGAGNPTVNAAYDPIAGDGACAAPSGADPPGLATYRLPAAPVGGFTLMGSPTIIADVNSPGPTSQLMARLVDVAPDGNATLVARGVYRPEINPGAEPTRQVFQLHPNGWQFAEGHVAKLELMPADTPYGRVSNGQLPVTVSNLELRLPVLEAPGGVVQEPAAKVVPAGYQLASDFLTGPPGDADGDGVLDGQDQCPNSPGPPSNDGCPTIGADADKDGIPDSQDDCPSVKGPASNGGCPVPATKTGPCGAAATRTGNAKRNVIIGTAGRDRLLGRGGPDRLLGKGGADCLSGQRGADRLAGGGGPDSIKGGPGRDRIFANDGSRDVVSCGSGRDFVNADRRDVLRRCERRILKGRG
jgi:predicted acyl esterase